MTTNLTTAPAPIFRPKPDQQLLVESIAEMLNASHEQLPAPEPSTLLTSAASEWRAAWLVSL